MVKHRAFHRAFRARFAFALTLAACLGPLALHEGTARAAEPEAETLPSTPKPFAYGLLVGANHGGPGQGDLRYAEDDARKVAQVLRDVGRYGQADMRVLSSPTPDEVMAALDVVGARLREHKAKGEQAILLFYYSGHAKAAAIQLGERELPLIRLRERLREMPSTLTLVMLDACQSGAFARTKGAEAASDFSYNSVARLTTQGIAVMASSSGQELSQESDELRSSYFTHHLLAGLRGAGDRDGDGRVTLDEAYVYAYRATLASTERTQVGAQHVTLETDLVGQGEVALSYPAAARSRLELPGALGARVLLQHKKTGAIVAEIHKAAGRPVRIAMAAGDYEATVHEGQNVWRCAAPLGVDQTSVLSLDHCERVRDTARAKGDDEPLPRWRRELNHYRLELGAGFSQFVSDGYTSRLEGFHYTRQKKDFDVSDARLGGSLLRVFGENLALGVEMHSLTDFEFVKTAGADTQTTRGKAFGGGALVRGVLPLLRREHGWGELYAQGELGFARSQIGVDSSAAHGTKTQTQWGPSFGATFGAAAGAKYAGAFFQGGYAYAPALRNEFDQSHNAAGFQFLTGLRFKTE